MNFLHSFLPQPVLINIGPFTIHWYGLFLVLGLAVGILVALKLSSWYKISQEKILDLALYLIIGGIIGARIYEIFLELPYYLDHPSAMIKVWEGGLAIHGAIIAGILILFIFSRYYKLSFLKLSALSATGLAIGQATGRFGNWFNQELFGLPTNLPWGIPIALENRPFLYQANSFFHPTFLYESLGCLLIFILLLSLSYYWRHHLNNFKLGLILITYLFSYSLLRFSLEFIKADQTPVILGWRWPQIISLIIMIICLALIPILKKQKQFKKAI